MPVPPQTGKIDVTPTVLYSVSGHVAAQQDYMHKGMNEFLARLQSYPDSGGHGDASSAFASAYLKVANRFVEVWGKTMVSVGGAAVGFTTTANNYAAADAATHPSGTAQPTHQAPPTVMDTPPGFPSVTDLKWGDFDAGQSIWQETLEGVEVGIAAVLRPALEHACNWGKASEIIPLPDYIGLDGISNSWLYPGVVLGNVNDGLTQTMSAVTDQNNSEWHAAMRQFCSAIWGTSAWGKERQGYRWGHAAPGSGQSQPIMAVLIDTCDVISDALRNWAEAAKEARDDMRSIFYDAVRESIPVDPDDGFSLKNLKGAVKGVVNLGKEFLGDLALNLDEDRMNATVAAYNNKVYRYADDLKQVLDSLDEAYLSAPTYQREVARAEGFGARALTEFKGDPLYTVPGDDESKHKYPVDLANQEGLSGAHVIDKHVGVSDDQLEQRLRDQQIVRPTGINPRAASSFENLEDAQRYTQATLDDPDNQQKIDRWLNNNPGPNSSRIIGLEFNDPVGRTWERGDSAAHDAKNVQVVLRGRPGGHPPYVVLTSMPTDQPPPP